MTHGLEIFDDIDERWPLVGIMKHAVAHKVGEPIDQKWREKLGGEEGAMGGSVGPTFLDTSLEYAGACRAWQQAT